MRSPFRTRLRPILRQPPPTGAAPRESISSVYLAASCDFFADGCDPPGRTCRVYTAARLRVAGSGLSHDSSTYVLSRRKPDSNGHYRDRAAGAPIRGTARFEPDDLH